MILDQEIKRTFSNNIEKIEADESDYSPSDATKERIQKVLEDFGIGKRIQDMPYREFNDRNVTDYQSDSQRAFNSYIPPRSGGPDEDWKAQTVRPITRNRVISIAAHMTGIVLFPKVFAQNLQDQEDKDAATVMRDLMEWAGEQADYVRSFVFAVVSALINPAVIIHTEYREIFRMTKVIQPDGTWIEEEVLDEENSGFKDVSVPIDELFIGDIREHSIQKQPFLIWRRVLDWTTAATKYKDFENFKFVKPGIQVLFAEDKDTFYEQHDDELQERLVEEILYFNKSLDVQLVLVNGVMIDDDPEQPLKRQDKQYPFVKSGYELVDEGKFFFFKSLVDKMVPDQDVVDILYNMIIDGTYLQLMPPVAIFGADEVDSSIIAPGAVTTFTDKDTKLQAIGAGNNLSAGFNTIQKVEASMSESSQDIAQAGQSAPGAQTAFEISRLEQNARTILGLFGKMVSFMVEDWGELRMGDIVQHMTVAQSSEVVDNSTRLKFRNFLIPERQIEGRTKTRRIEFDMEVKPGLEESFRLLEEEGEDNQIMRVNPTLFRNLKFKVKVSPDFKAPVSETLEKSLNLEAYDRAIANPNANQEAIFRDFLLGSYEISRDDPDKYIARQGAPLKQRERSSELISQITGGGELPTSDLAQ